LKNKAIIDSKEPDDVKKLVKKQLEKKGFNVETKALDQGDYHYPHQGVILERKEKSDLAASIQDRRISEQADRMAANHDHLYVLVEGDIYDLQYSNLHHNSIRGQLISLAVKRNVKVLPTENKEGTAYTVARLFERYKDEEHMQETQYLKTHDTGEVDDIEVAMLMQIDGISKQKAKDIIKAYGGPAQLAYAQTDEAKVRGQLMTVDGIGPKLANRVIKVFQQN